MKSFFPKVAALGLIALLAPLVFHELPVAAHPPAQGTPYPKFNLKDPCPRDPNNLIVNGTMRDEHSFQFGSMADGWDAFIFAGAPPAFRRVDNEGIDGGDSQQIFSTDAFDAGIYQTVRNLQPGASYLFRLGYALAAKSYGGGNVRVDSIGRKVGVDPAGGTDPHSANVIWGPDLFDGNAALNLREMTMIFAARADRATIFLRAIARDGSSGENRVWLDAVCMEPRPEIPAVALPPPTVPATNTAAPLARPSATRVSPTRVPATRVATLTRTPTVSARAISVTATAPAPRARPLSEAPVETGFSLDFGAYVGIGISALIGSVFCFGVGFILVRR